MTAVAEINIPSWQHRKIYGYARMTRNQYIVLAHLKRCDDADWPWQPLNNVATRTLNCLRRRDWIIRSKGHDGIKYAVTPRGKLALRAYSAPIQHRRRDGICPCCGKRPIHITETGNRCSYCHPCLNQYNRAMYRLYHLNRRQQKECI